MKNKFALIAGILLLVLTIVLGFIFGTTFSAALSMETGMIGLLVYIIPILLMGHSFFPGKIIPVIFIVAQLFLYLNNFIFGFVRF